MQVLKWGGGGGDRSVFPVHGSYKKEDLDKFIILFYTKERESIIIWAELVLKEMALRFKKTLK